jgi:hypothetical protein
VVVFTDGGRPKPDAAAGGAGTGGAGTGGAGGIDAGPTCDPGLDLCPGDICADFQADNNHCGNCTTICAAPNVCTGGKCEAPCDPGLTACGGNCVDLDTSEAHCGACNRGCPGGTVCESRQCLIDCGSLTRCPGNLCVDTQNDQIHCGNCTTVCTGGQLCSGGTCKTNCTNPLVNCNNVCVNFMTDEVHCGGCPGVACPTGQNCVNGTCQTLVENCQNGIDDDEDNLVDCADPNCTAFTCATTPLGWTGPVALWSGASGSAPSCPATYPSDVLDAHDNLIVPPYTCPSCTCSPQNAACPSMTFWLDTTTDCTSLQAFTIPVSATAGCTSHLLGVKPNEHVGSSQLKPGTYASGSCVGSQPNPLFPNPSWGTDVLACGGGVTTGGGCGAGQCLPKPAAPFNTKLCIFRQGINACPSSYPTEMPSAQNPQYYAAFTDSRTCSSCACGAPTCGGTVSWYAGPSCGGTATSVDITGGCTTLPVVASSGGAESRSVRWTNGGAICGAATSSLTGAVTPDTPVTVCCQN